MSTIDKDQLLAQAFHIIATFDPHYQTEGQQRATTAWLDDYKVIAAERRKLTLARHLFATQSSFAVDPKALRRWDEWPEHAPEKAPWLEKATQVMQMMTETQALTPQWITVGPQDSRGEGSAHWVTPVLVQGGQGSGSVAQNGVKK